MQKEFASFLLESLGKIVVTIISLALNHAALLAGGLENVTTWYIAAPGPFLALGAINLLMAFLFNRVVPGTVLNWGLGFALAIAETTALAFLMCGGAGMCV